MAMDDCRASFVKLFGQVISLLPPTDHPAPANPEETIPAGPDRSHDAAEQETADAKGESEEKQPQPPKKPDKILPCPRCNSMDTKFCYYNNYNVNQPRYFCRDCQRYWTAGGSMRNVPVGAGRRKSKSSAERQLRHITISAVPQTDAVLRSMAFLNDGAVADGGRIEFLPSEVPRAPARDNRAGVVLPGQDHRAGICQVHPFWVYQYWPPTAAAAAGQLGFHPYWGAGVLQSPPSAGLSISGPSTSALGKHSRDEHNHTPERSSKLDMIDTHEITEKPTERRLWAPKGLRIIDDADEVASSSVWATLGIKKDKAGDITHGGLFSAFHPKMHKTGPETPGAAAILAANPAAMARSLNFNECI